MIVLDLIYNLSLLVALSVISGFIDARFDRGTTAGQVGQGLLFGVIVLIGMRYPFVFSEGIIFDGRSIVISLCAVFFGPLAGLIASGIGIVYRVYLGGGGALTGVLVISASFLIGWWFHRWRKNAPPGALNITSLYILGLI